MAFTYTPGSPEDITRVRWHIGDTVEASAIFTDAEITFVISEASTWQKAVIACIKTILAKIAAEPDFSADWLKVDQKRAMEGYTRLLQEKRQEFGQPLIVAGTTTTFRSDSLQDEAPDW